MGLRGHEKIGGEKRRTRKVKHLVTNLSGRAKKRRGRGTIYSTKRPGNEGTNIQ